MRSVVLANALPPNLMRPGVCSPRPTLTNIRSPLHSTMPIPFLWHLLHDTLSLAMCVSTDQIDLLRPGTTRVLQNAHVDMAQSCMRLVVGAWGSILPYREGTPDGRLVLMWIFIYNDVGKCVHARVESSLLEHHAVWIIR